MKRFLALAALVLGMVSCQTEPEGLDVIVGGEVDTVVTVTIPEAETRANSAEGAFENVVTSDNYTIRYIFAVYYGDTCNRQYKYSDDTSVAFDVRLVPDRDYQFVVWADVVEENGKVDGEYRNEDGLHYNTENLKAITLWNGTLKNDTWVAMDETRDAFTGTLPVVNFNGSQGITVKLTRPFAKLRVVTTDFDELAKFGITATTATVSYTTSHRVAFNAYSGVAADATSDNVSHEYTIVDYDDNADEDTIFVDYFFAGANDVVKFNLAVYEDANKTKLIKANSFNTDIPVKRNHLTTIKGNILTDGNNIKVEVENGGAFGGEENVDVVEVSNASDLQEAINDADEGHETHIELSGDIDLDDLLNAGILSTRAENNSYGLLIPAGKSIVLDLKDYTISQEKACTDNYNMILNKGNLTITGNGKISFKDTGNGDPNFGWGSYTLRNEGTLVVENGTIEHLGEQNPGDGQPNVHMYCAIFQYSGNTIINGGTISTPTYRSARLWNGNMTINGGEFEGQLWLQAVSDNANLVINGGTFSPRGNDGSSVFVSNSGKAVDCSITGGTFETKVGMSEPFECITGGTFTTEAKEATSEELLANGYAFVEGENGTYTVENVGHYTDAEGNYYITNAKGLAWVSENVNTMQFYGSGSANIFDNVTVYLANDIDLGGAEWRPIGDYAFSRTSFNGVFDGQGYTVSNFKVTEPVRWTEKVTEASFGFFGNVKGTIKNLTIKNATVNPEGGRYSAALVGRLHNGGCIENCHVENSSVTILHWQVGGLVGQNNNGNISGCSVVGSTITGKAAVGAIVGMDMAAGEHTIENCRVANTALVQNESFGASYDASYGLAVGLVNAKGIVLNVENVVAENNTIKDAADNTLVGDIVAGATVTINGVSIATTAEQLAAAIKAGGECALGADIAMTADIYQNVDVTIDGNGHTISQLEGSTNTYALFDSVTGNITLKNVKFAGIKGGAVLRTAGAVTNIDNVTIEGAETTQQQGLLRLLGKSTIKNSTFKNNSCSMVITLNYDGANNDPQVVENCVFEGNTCNGTAVLYYVKGENATIVNNKFIGNTVNCNGNGATVYMGFTEGNVVKDNLFQNNTVNEAGDSSRVAGGIFFGYETIFTGNAFVGNKVTGTDAKGNDVCVSTYYTAIDLSGNYWGGNAPVEDVNYFVQHKSDERAVIINDYLTENPIK